MKQSDIEKLFEVFAMHYGSARMASHWKDLNAAKMAELWARKLSHMPRRNIGYAMANLPADFPPSIDEFLAICRRCPNPTFKALEDKPTPEEIAATKAKWAELSKRFGTRAA